MPAQEKGGLGILDLECFARALRLRWLWFQWKHRERAWNDLDLPVDSRDRDLFATSSEVTIGDGNRASFWQSRRRSPNANFSRGHCYIRKS
jgi:hypothetical protein